MHRQKRLHIAYTATAVAPASDLTEVAGRMRFWMGSAVPDSAPTCMSPSMECISEQMDCIGILPVTYGPGL